MVQSAQYPVTRPGRQAGVHAALATVVIAGLVTGCAAGPSALEATVVAQATLIVALAATPTPSATPTPAREPTALPQPTYTPEPTYTPQPTHTPQPTPRPPPPVPVQPTPAPAEVPPQSVPIDLAPLAAAHIPRPLPAPQPLSAEVRNATWWVTVSLVTKSAGAGYSQGTGIVVAADGAGFTILTAHHVIADQEEGQPILVGPFGGWSQSATVLAAEPRLDLALLRVESNVLIYSGVRVGDSNNVAPGESVYLFGYPATGRGGLVISEGILLGQYTSRRRTYLGTNAEASPGSSGGVAVNSRGELIGIVTGVIRNRSTLAAMEYPEVSVMTLLVPVNQAGPLLAQSAGRSR